MTDSNETMTNIKNQPKIMISSYRLEPKMVEAGSSFDLYFTLYNTNAKNTIYNLKATLEQNPQTQPQNSGENEALVSDGSVFTPTSRSNSFYVSALYPWNTSTQHINMDVLPNAVAGSYILNLTLEYEDYEGNQYKTTESIGVPVVQRAGVTLGNVKVPELIEGEPAEISVDIYNTGKDNLNTFMCDVIGKGIEIDKDRRFIGNFKTGSQETFSFTATPTRDGEVEGQVMVSYEDSTGKVHNQSIDFKGESMPGMADEPMGEMEGYDPDMDPNSYGGGSVLTSPFLWIGLIALAILGVMAFRKRRKKKQDEELLIDDED